MHRVVVVPSAFRCIERLKGLKGCRGCWRRRKEEVRGWRVRTLLRRFFIYDKLRNTCLIPLISSERTPPFLARSST